MIAIRPLPYISYRINGGLNTLQIGPLPNQQTNVIESNVLIINGVLPDLGKPGKPSTGAGGPGGGQYVEILIDDDAEASRITTHVPYALHLPDGTHMLHFLLSSGDGECIKEGVQAISRVVHIQRKTRPTWEHTGPMIVYNLPRAAHRINDIIVDFAVLNVPIEPLDITGSLRMINHEVSVRIDGGEFDGSEVDRLDVANTHLVSGLTPGVEYTIELVLIDRATGELDPLLHPFARTKPRRFTPR